ncbi:hypothetical protein DFP73DRAFT_211586 [Morchella snyderi]|nr:hypothetical protein DFP73DRAFT_211586 [Morchella snyderi]
MEPISFTVGTVIGLAGLYSVCLQAMEQINDGRNFAKDSQTSYTLFEVERWLLRVWGKKVGIEKESDFHRFLKPGSPEYPVIRGILRSLESILSSGDDLCKKYGLVSKEDISFGRKYVWAVRDKKAFDRLVKDIATLVEKLSAIVPPEGDPRFGEHETNKQLAVLKANLDERDRSLAEETVEQQKHRQMVEGYIENRENHEALKWIGAISTEVEYDESKRKISPGTCEWILSNKEFTNWLCPPEGINTSRLLWIHGRPGMGKTFISAKVVEYLQQHFSCPTAFFFCTHSNSKKNQTLSIIKSWIIQLAKQRANALGIIRKSKRSNNEAVATVQWDIFRAILKELGSCYLIVDGLDECLDIDPTSQGQKKGEMEIFLGELISSTYSTGVKLLIISRHIVELRSVFNELAYLSNVSASPVFKEYEILNKDNREDIESFLMIRAKKAGLGDKKKTTICKQLSTSSEGMFLWARLCSDRLKPGITPQRLRTILTDSPPGLDRSYERNLKAILSKEKYDQDRAIAILRLVLFSLRPLKLKELIHALEINDYKKDMTGNTRGFQEDVLPTDDDKLVEMSAALIETCGSLIEIREVEGGSSGDWSVQFIHFTAKEYLLGLHEGNCSDPKLLRFSFLQPEKHHAALTNTCLLYLVISGIIQEDQGHNTKAAKDWEFREYASSNWDRHFHLSGKELSASYEIRQKIFLDSGPTFDAWRVSSSYRLESRSWVLNGLERDLDDQINKLISPSSISSSGGSSQLLATCMLGMPDIMRKHLEESEKGIPEAACLVAAYHNQETIIELLVKRGDVDVNAHACGITPLSAASIRGHEGIVRLLLTRDDIRVNELSGGNIYNFKEPGSTALSFAVVNNKEAVARELLKRRDLDVNSVDHRFDLKMTPLTHAIMRNRVDLVKLLLRNTNINVNLAPDVDEYTPLHWAARAEEGSVEILALLLEREDILVNPRSTSGKTPLDTRLDRPKSEISEIVAERIREKGGKLSNELPETSPPNAGDYLKQKYIIPLFILLFFLYLPLPLGE